MSKGAAETSDRDDALAVVRRLREAGYIAYFAGGCVRDSLLGLTPADWDVATDAPPGRVRQLFNNTQAVGAAFGVILVRHHGSTIEVATFRADLEYLDGRRPEGVRFTTAESDARRRDFTINGLFFDPIENRVIDFVGGQADLKNKVLRAIGDPGERFAEDHLRLLRAVRFAARFGLEIEVGTGSAIIAHSQKLPRISPERIADELRRMLMEPTRADAWGKLQDLSLNKQLFRFLEAGEETGFERGRSIFNGVQVEGRLSFGLALGAATVDYQWQRAGRPGDVRPWLGKGEIAKTLRAMRTSLKISNEESDDLRGTLTGARSLLAEPAVGIAGTKRFLATSAAANSRALLAAIAGVGLHTERIETVERELAELEKTEFAPMPLITGDDLTGAGLLPGPRFKLALDAAYDAQLEGRVKTKVEALALAMGMVGEVGR